MSYKTPTGIYPQIKTGPRLSGAGMFTPDLRGGLILRSVFEGIPNTRFVRAGDPTPRAVMVAARRDYSVGQQAQFARTVALMPVSPVRPGLI